MTGARHTPACTTVDVEVTTLEQTAASDIRPARPLPEGARIEHATAASPGLVRWLYATVGGPWQWVDRLDWPRQQWADELAMPGSEVHIAYAEGTPAGYVQLGAVPDASGTAVEIRYFGLMEWAIGRGLGGGLLTHGLERAWTLGERHALPATHRVWLHTCSLDGPHALANYQARGLRVVGVHHEQQRVPAQPLNAWTASTGWTPKS